MAPVTTEGRAKAAMAKVVIISFKEGEATMGMVYIIGITTGTKITVAIIITDTKATTIVTIIETTLLVAIVAFRTSRPSEATAEVTSSDGTKTSLAAAAIT